MKNKIKILLLVAFGVLLFTTCQKDPKLPMPELQKTIIPLVTKDITKDGNLSFIDLPGFNASVIVDLYYDDMPKSMDLMVCMNGDVENTGVVKTDITSFPTSTDFSVGTLIDILPGLNDINQLKLGDNFKFYVDITLDDGTVIKGNDTLYSAFDPAVSNLPGSSLNVVYTIACPLDPAMTEGSYFAYSAPSEWNASGNITITADATDPNTVYVSGLYTIEGGDEDKGPLVMHIDPVTFDVTVDKTVIATDYFGYTNGAFGGTGTYNTCTGEYIMKFAISVDEGNFGDYIYSLTRN